MKKSKEEFSNRVFADGIYALKVKRIRESNRQDRIVEHMSENELAKIVVDICFRIHTQYGPGMFESVYEEIFCFEWDKTGVDIVRQQGIKVVHKGVDMGIGFIPDLVVGKKVILELKSVETLAELHYKQLLTYLRLTNMKLGLLINFNVPLIKNGIHRIVNNL